MAQSRFYSSTAQPTVLTASITPTTTIIQLQQTVGFPPNVPFILALDYNTPSEEVVLCTALAGTNATVTRGYDGTSATSHNAGAAVRHTWTAMDGNDSRAHEGSTSGVHGVTGNVVGTTDTQTLTNKTLNGATLNTPTITNPSFSGTVNLISPNITGTVTGGASYTAPTITNPTITGTVAGSGTYTSPNITGTVTGGATYQNMTVSPTAITVTPLQVMALAGQTNPLQLWQDSTPATLARVRQTGEISSNIGLQCGASNQFAVNSVGNVTTSGTLAAGNTTVNGNLTVTGIGQLQFRRKTADQSVTNSTTLVNDTDLTFPVVANAVYVLRGLIGGTGSTAGDLKFGFVGPVGATLDWTPTMQPLAATATTGTVITDRSIIGQTQALGTIGTGSILTSVVNGLLVTAANAGTFVLQFAQQAADPTSSTIKAASYLVLERVA